MDAVGVTTKKAIGRIKVKDELCDDETFVKDKWYDIFNIDNEELNKSHFGVVDEEGLEYGNDIFVYEREIAKEIEYFGERKKDGNDEKGE